jgi:hypothetical protein
MSGEAGYLSPASPLVLQVLSISLIGLGRVATFVKSTICIIVKAKYVISVLKSCNMLPMAGK